MALVKISNRKENIGNSVQRSSVTLNCDGLTKEKQLALKAGAVYFYLFKYQ